MEKVQSTKEIFLYIDQNSFLRNTFEIAFKEKEVAVYTLATLLGNEYLITELNPKLIVFDLESCKLNSAQLASISKEIQLLAVGDESTFDDFQKSVNFRKIHFLKRPFIAKDLTSIILKFFS